ncbi:cupin domain-containing protein [Novosphingobium album (ex Hu et al. 2023)]|uniref:Cupin domain-containing protein n=1 Tax=Novosphingobium album (ex Hu et al. 2023) TaxID=2930093 RepID=A0ABT0B3V4_9SPHN|nr:cupin domain-containing protein [Novosphingobium album (ex Hu et al. 2023)]MCJ2179740.1 cupin domain-containing protein [Novosphingobium album (ex Hu et al. 2023)]
MQTDSANAAAIIEKLGLAPHPEGGWYVETWRAETAPGVRPGATAIHFLLEAHQRSHWHRIDAAEIWLWHAGAPVTLSIAADDTEPVRHHTLGGDVLAGEAPQVLVPEGHWQAAAPQGGWTLVSCVVSPGFEFAGFELAVPDWHPGN